MDPVPLASRLVLIRPGLIAERLEQVRRSGLVAEVPNLWQLTLGVARMWYRVMDRPETIGLSTTRPVRGTLAARLFRSRPMRALPALLSGALRPWDLSGLLTGPSGMIRHLIGTHHDRHQFAYDLQILSIWPGQLEVALAEARRTAEGHATRDELFRDLSVFEGYHQTLVHAIERAMDGDWLLTPDEQDDPDVSFIAYLRWCRAQPATPAATLAAVRRGQLDLERHRPRLNAAA